MACCLSRTCSNTHFIVQENGNGITIYYSIIIKAQLYTVAGNWNNRNQFLFAA